VIAANDRKESSELNVSSDPSVLKGLNVSNERSALSGLNAGIEAHVPSVQFQSVPLAKREAIAANVLVAAAVDAGRIGLGTLSRPPNHIWNSRTILSRNSAARMTTWNPLPVKRGYTRLL